MVSINNTGDQRPPLRATFMAGKGHRMSSLQNNGLLKISSAIRGTVQQRGAYSIILGLQQ